MASAAVLAVALAGSAAHAAAELWPRSAGELPSVETRIDELLARMSLEDKVGQVIMAEIGSVSPAEVRRFRLGGILNGGGSWPGRDKRATAGDWAALAERYHVAALERNDGRPEIPPLWGTDAVHGHNNVVGATLFPHNIGLGAGRNPALVREIGRATAREVAATGLGWTFAPTLAVPQDDRWGRTYEGFSEDPAIVAELGAAAIQGLQGEVGDGFLGEGRILAPAKHFNGDGGTRDGKDQGDTRITEAWLSRIHGVPYRAALAAGVQTVMVSFNSWNGRKLHGHAYLLTDVLKRRLGFDGFVVGDWNGHEQLPGCAKDNCPDALNAGVDMFMVPEDWKALYRNTLRQARSGRIPPARLEDAVRRILRVKSRAGLLDGSGPASGPLAGRQDLIGHPEHRALARRAVRESLVLLKNNGGVLPLDPAGRILVAGAAADRIASQAGGWSVTWQGDHNANADFPGATSILDGIRKRVGSAGGSVEFARGGGWEERPDAAILVYGEEPYAEFQGDRAELRFDPPDRIHLEISSQLRAQGVPVVSVFLSGRPLWIHPELNASDALVAAWLPGSEGGGVADLLFAEAGDTPEYDFVGRLPFSWPAARNQRPQNPHDPGYRPLFPLGYGLSYSNPAEVGPLDETEDATARSDLGRLLFEGHPSQGFQVALQEAAQPAVRVAGGGARTASGRVSVELRDHQRQEDTSRLRFAGGGLGAWILSGDELLDWSEEARNGAVLTFDLRLLQAGNGPLYASLVCGPGCRGSIPIEDLLAEQSAEGWRSFGVPLLCFSSGGADLSRISVPLVLLTEAAWEFDLGAVRLEPVGVADRVLECSF
ncbi:MAG: glycoside hydrolase family 3 C-terminal domain-containing protein [Proteobacteria bacterium]|nr:glycoside hydrolase family 3 C-terminal domain-containing protein [Pseudomonadota bacterium]